MITSTQKRVPFRSCLQRLIPGTTKSRDIFIGRHLFSFHQACSGAFHTITTSTVPSTSSFISTRIGVHQSLSFPIGTPPLFSDTYHGHGRMLSTSQIDSHKSPYSQYDKMLLDSLARKDFVGLKQCMRMIFYETNETLHYRTFCQIIYSFILSKHKTALDRSEMFLQWLVGFHQCHRLVPKPAMAVFNRVLNAWYRSKDPRAAHRAESLLVEMERLYQRKVLDFLPSRKMYNLVLTILKSNKKLNRAQALFDRMHSNEDIGTDIASWVIMMDAHSLSNNENAGETVEEMLRKIKFLFPNKINTKVYGIAMKAYSWRGNLEKTQSLFDELQEEYARQRNEKLRPDLKCYGILLRTWAVSGKPDAAEKAEEILSTMEALFPDIRHSINYRNLMLAYAHRGDVAKAQAIFNEINEEFQRTQNNKLKPTLELFAVLLKAHANAEQANGGEKAEETLEQMKALFPNRVKRPHYHFVMKAYAHCGKIEKTQAIFDSMNQEFLQHNKNDLRPTVTTWVFLLLAHARSSDPNAGEKAEAMLKNMNTLFETGFLEQRPTAICYNIVIDSYAKAGKATEAENMLELMYRDYLGGNTSGQPDNHSFDGVLKAWVESKSDDAAKRAEAILDRMSKLGANGTLPLKPNIVNYSSVMKAYEEKASAEDAERVLEKSMNAYREGNKEAKPNLVVFRQMLKALSHSESLDAAEKADRILSQMAEFGVMQDAVCTRFALKCWKEAPTNPMAKARCAVLQEDVKRLLTSKKSTTSPET